MFNKLFRAVIMGAPASGKGTISSRVINSFNVQHVSSGNVLRNNILEKTDDMIIVETIASGNQQCLLWLFCFLRINVKLPLEQCDNHIIVGIFKSSSKENLGLKVKKYVERGHLVPDKLMVSLVVSELAKLSNENWLLDGFPRTVNQAEELHKREPIDVALNLDVPFSVIVERTQNRWIHQRSGRIYNTEYSPPKVWGKDDVTGEDLIQRVDDQLEAVKNRLETYSQTVEPILCYYENQGILKTFSGNTSDEIWPNLYEFLAHYIKPKKISYCRT